MSDNYLEIDSPPNEGHMSLIISGRCASTPTNPDRLSLAFEPSFTKLKKSPNFIDPVNVEFGEQPIFGRRNLQSIFNEYANTPAQAIAKKTEEAAKNDAKFYQNLAQSNLDLGFFARKKSTQDSSTITEHFKENIKVYANKESTIPTVKKPKDYKIISSSIKRHERRQKNSATTTDDFKRNIKKSGIKESNNPLKTPKVYKIISLRNIGSMIKKRRSTYNESQLPILTVTAKIPKSPRLLTALRARFKENRKRMRKESDPINLQPSVKQNFKSLAESTKKSKNTFNFKQDCDKGKKQVQNKNTGHFQSSNKLMKLEQNIKTCNKELGIHKLSGEKKQIKAHIEQEIEGKKMTAFKACPIRQYVPLPIVRKQKLTIPESPKLSKRSRLYSCSR